MLIYANVIRYLSKFTAGFLWGTGTIVVNVGGCTFVPFAIGRGFNDVVGWEITREQLHLLEDELVDSGPVFISWAGLVVGGGTILPCLG